MEKDLPIWNTPSEKRVKGNLLRNKKLTSELFDIKPNNVPKFIDGKPSRIFSCFKESYDVIPKKGYKSIGHLFKELYSKVYCFEYIIECIYNDPKPENEWLESLEDNEARVYKDIYFRGEDEDFEKAILKGIALAKKHLMNELRIIKTIG